LKNQKSFEQINIHIVNLKDTGKKGGTLGVCSQIREFESKHRWHFFTWIKWFQ